MLAESKRSQYTKRKLVREIKKVPNLKNFKFVLLVSYKTEEEAIGRELC